MSFSALLSFATLYSIFFLFISFLFSVCYVIFSYPANPFILFFLPFIVLITVFYHACLNWILLPNVGTAPSSTYFTVILWLLGLSIPCLVLMMKPIVILLMSLYEVRIRLLCLSIIDSCCLGFVLFQKF